MDNTFDLPVTYNGKDLLLPAALITYGYSYKIEVNIFDVPVFFEPDEERHFRAVAHPGALPDHKSIDTALLQTIAVALHVLFA